MGPRHAPPAVLEHAVSEVAEQAIPEVPEIPWRSSPEVVAGVPIFPQENFANSL